MQPLSTRQGLLVLGMHRSGTSATAGVLGKLGCAVPADLMGPGIGNEKGHWEALGVMAVNDRILDSGGSSWEDWDRFNPEWYASLLYPAAVENARAALRASFGNAPLFVMKDPRICRLVPLWLEVLEAEAIDPAIVLCVRHPAEVAASLASRDGMEAGYAHLLWLRHMLEAEAETRGRKRIISHFDQLRQDWSSQVSRIGKELGIVWPKLSANTRRDIGQFMEPSPSASASARPPSFTMPWSERVHAILKRWAEQGEDRSDDAELDEILHKFNVAADGFSSVILAGSRSLGPGGGHAAKEALAQAEANLAAHVQAHDGAIRELEGRLEAALRSEMAVTAAFEERAQATILIEHQLAHVESTLRQREEEIVQTGRERDEARVQAGERAAQLETLNGALEQAHADILRLTTEHQSAQTEAVAKERLIEDLHARLAAEQAELRAAVDRAEQANLEAHARHLEEERIVAERHRAEMDQLVQHEEWLRQINAILLERPYWWAMMPAAWQRRQEQAVLRRRGLFDSQAYLQLNPDVAANGEDPVRHYLMHGMEEGRRLIR